MQGVKNNQSSSGKMASFRPLAPKEQRGLGLELGTLESLLAWDAIGEVLA